MEEVVKELPELLNNNQISSEMIVLDRRNEINILDRGIKINFTPIKTSEKSTYIEQILKKRNLAMIVKKN